MIDPIRWIRSLAPPPAKTTTRSVLSCRTSIQTWFMTIHLFPTVSDFDGLPRRVVIGRCAVPLVYERRASTVTGAEVLVVITPDEPSACVLHYGELKKALEPWWPREAAAWGAEIFPREALDKTVAVLLTRGVSDDVRARFVGDGWSTWTVLVYPGVDVYETMTHATYDTVTACQGKTLPLLYDATEPDRVVIWERKPTSPDHAPNAAARFPADDAREEVHQIDVATGLWQHPEPPAGPCRPSSEMFADGGGI
jgi:hypothetical protein